MLRIETSISCSSGFEFGFCDPKLELGPNLFLKTSIVLPCWCEGFASEAQISYLKINNNRLGNDLKQDIVTVWRKVLVRPVDGTVATRLVGARLL